MVAADDSWLDPAVPGRVLRSYPQQCADHALGQR